MKTYPFKRNNQLTVGRAENKETYSFVLKNKNGERCCHISKETIERNYGLLEEEAYTFFAPAKVQTKVFYLSDHPRFKKEKIAERLS